VKAAGWTHVRPLPLGSRRSRTSPTNCQAAVVCLPVFFDIFHLLASASPRGPDCKHAAPVAIRDCSTLYCILPDIAYCRRRTESDQAVR
jgi:hypothetical protein